MNLGSYRAERLTGPARTTVLDAKGEWVATFTDGCVTVTLRGLARIFAEPNATPHKIVSTTWVRLLARPFAGAVDQPWLSAALIDTSPDVLAVAMQYIAGAPPILDAIGLKIAGDAGYGPLQADGMRAEGSDFNDYLGVYWHYGATVDLAEAAELGCLDCSGFMRMVYGYRGRVPLCLSPDGRSLPRRSRDQAASAPGIVVIPNTGKRPASLAALQPGDLVFFDADTDDGTAIDHVGIWLGVDSGGHSRFISSRKSINGPTLGDFHGASILDGEGLYATTFRTARRL